MPWFGDQEGFHTVAGLVLLHEQLSGLQWLAIACIVVASVGAILTTGRDEAAPLPA